MQLTTKTIVVTGAGSGIGRELTRQLLRSGANVAGVDINPASLQETQRLAGVAQDRLKTFALDITNQRGRGRFTQPCTEPLRRLSNYLPKACTPNYWTWADSLMEKESPLFNWKTKEAFQFSSAGLEGPVRLLEK